MTGVGRSSPLASGLAADGSNVSLRARTQFRGPTLTGPSPRVRYRFSRMRLAIVDDAP